MLIVDYIYAAVFSESIKSVTNYSLTGTTAAVGLQKVIETNYLTVGPVAFFLSQNIHIEVGQECTVWEGRSQ